MKPQLLAASLLILAPSAFAALPMLNYDCPNDIQVHADEGGPVYINGKEAKLKKSNDNYFEAKDKESGVTVSISIAEDGTPSVSYTGAKGANGICQAAEGD
ncbi:hypothetical protein NK553_16595 [Pseudomonas sp. ZM23]|uniref:Lipoprotein n=1 Tax=Pseudomonas triclosanedens TaxID=2961893 RepID=A0ABY7A4J6_9PSED|nr:hypothetical protein [Pseudomonas triclosanedens]MCP8465569.1 hypothetical protein [Pseudomonas triclosanedens]MCP8471064.1 hypothetical protein [Pseudomonas triclosanedens]MCP8476868.1 hypothetical protein [Pseudomonas triclosanedens]WAI52018.1 hypothetical protein OU419_12450 [Pseudomonas triclosanedens]